ncbi:MAG: TetR/AcrR family transcriptional regulator [Lachnospiraceae bacterium]|nr:TetR/AcrR family transcriptional regulator [Lachnospiraceae bacterium]
MPPKEKVSRVMVLEAAFEMTRENGFENVTARKLAQKLGSSTQPIFRAYENMEMLKEELFYKSAEMFSDYMLSSREKGKPVYLSMGMAYIDMACKEKHLFKLIADIEEYETEDLHEFLQQGDCKELLEKLPKTEKLSPDKKKEVFRMVWMFTHGVATLVTSKRVNMQTEEIEDMLKKAYEGFVSAVIQ